MSVKESIGHRGIVLLNDDLNVRWIDWMSQAGLNVLGFHERESKDYCCIEKTIEMVQSEKGKKLISMALERGIDVEYELHAISWLLPRSEFHRHPEWFRADEKGNRVPTHNMCPSNKDALAVVRDNAKKLAGILSPTTNNYYLWADDVENAICHCKECSRYNGSDQNLIIMNEIIKGLKDKHLEAKLAYLAYADALEISRMVEPENGIFLEFAPIKRRLNRPLNDLDVPENRKYALLLNELIQFFGVKNAHVLEYWLDASLFSKWKKPSVKIPFDNDLLKRDIAFYKGKGVDFITTFGAFIDEDYYNLHGMPPVEEYGRALAEC